MLCLWQDFQGMQKDQPFQVSMQVSPETAVEPQTSKDWQVDS